MDRIGKYEILDKIGTGGFAVVYKGWDPYIRRPVAVKVCMSRDSETKERFRREAEIAGFLEHRNITTVYDAGVHENTPYLVEEYLSGEDLAHLVRRQEPQAIEKKFDYLIQIADGLGYAHSKAVIHRDIKPGNIRVLDNGRLKIMDFGTAKLANVESNLTQTGMTLGTVAYLSPERLLGQSSGTNSDIFSYGVLAYELLSFRRPFAGRNIPNLIDQVLNAAPIPLRECWEECPPGLVEVVERCLHKDPQQRYASCEEVLNDLQKIQAEVCPHMLPQESSAAIPQVSVQLSGLLERARQLFERGKYDRAEILLDEVLEINPNHRDAQDLMAACQGAKGAMPKDPSATQHTALQGSAPQVSGYQATGNVSPPGVEHTPTEGVPISNSVTQRLGTNPQVGEAITTINRTLDQRQLPEAAEALRFAREKFGDLPELRPLRQRIVGELHRELMDLKGQALRQARGIVQRMERLRGQNLLPLELAQTFVSWVSDLDPDDLAARHILAAVEREARDHERARQAEISNAKKLEAVASIEKLLAEGNPQMAAQALRFAVRLFGDFEQKPHLEQRIQSALGHQG